MGLNDVFDNLKRITCEPNYHGAIEWLGCPWGHAVAPSTPVQDFRLHVKAWQHHFAAVFGFEALARVRGFSPSEMALPNHPDMAYEFVKTLKEGGFDWVIVQEHSVEHTEDGNGPERKHLPHRLICRNSLGQEATIIAIIKTQGSDTKLVAQMQPYYEARALSRWELAGKQIPPLVTQIADGENGGVMMNEFPGKYFEVMRECSGSDTPAMNVTEYLEHLAAEGVGEIDLPPLQPLFQKRIWDRCWFGLRPKLEDEGITLVSMSQRSGTSLSKEYVGNVFAIQQVYGGQTFHLIDVAHQQKLMDDRVEIRLGRIAAGDDFLVSQYDYLFMQNGFDGNPAGIFFNSPGMTAYPNATWGARLKVRSTERTYVMGGVYNGDPSIRKNAHNGADMSMNGPVFAIGEAETAAS